MRALIFNGGTEGNMVALILAIALEVGIDGKLAVSVVRAENISLEAEKVGITGDLGIMQLNPNYLEYFADQYWDKEWAFDWRTPYDNVYVGLKHLKYLVSLPGFNVWMALIAYNAGESAVRSGNPPDSSIDYANKIMRSMNEK
jgi:soluble lytic murein transglycosylase-like protein